MRPPAYGRDQDILELDSGSHRGGQLCSPGNIWSCLEVFITTREGVLRALVGRNQGSRSMSQNAQDTPPAPQQGVIWPQTSIVGVLRNHEQKTQTHGEFIVIIVRRGLGWPENLKRRLQKRDGLILIASLSIVCFCSSHLYSYSYFKPPPTLNPFPSPQLQPP